MKADGPGADDFSYDLWMLMLYVTCQKAPNDTLWKPARSFASWERSFNCMAGGRCVFTQLEGRSINCAHHRGLQIWMRSLMKIGHTCYFSSNMCPYNHTISSSAAHFIYRNRLPLKTVFASSVNKRKKIYIESSRELFLTFVTDTESWLQTSKEGFVKQLRSWIEIQ